MVVLVKNKTRLIRKYIGMNENKNGTYQNYGFSAQRETYSCKGLSIKKENISNQKPKFPP